MRDYARVSPRFWIGDTGRQIRAGGADSQVVALYLLTSPHSNMIGLYWQPVAYIAHETSIGIEGATKALASLCEAGFCRYDTQTEVVWVCEMARFQIGDELKPNDKQRKGVQNAYDEVPANPFLEEFFERYADAFGMSKARVYEGACKPLGSKAQAQAQAQEKAQAQAQAADALSRSDLPVVISLPLIGDKLHPVTQDRVDFWRSLYTAVDVDQELRKMAGWLSSNPTRRKTARGIEAFVTNWLSRTQDNSRPGAQSAIPGFAKGAQIEAHNSAVLDQILESEGMK